jgi:glycolate oxidase FAD binding subunit
MDNINALKEQVAAIQTSVNIVGAGTKSFLGNVNSELPSIEMSSHQGVIEYYPTELVIRARAGTPIKELLALVEQQNQMLAFDPPNHAAAATLGGVVASGLSGSRRPYAGSVKDFVLGAGMILHDGTYSEFGGQVMKNVAGYDVSRLVTGSFGVLGVIADVSLKILPKPALEISRTLELDLMTAQTLVGDLTRAVSPLSANCYADGILSLRFSGSETAVEQTLNQVGGDSLDANFWSDIDTQQAPMFDSASELWRLSTQPQEPLADNQYQLLEWGFSQRWLFDPESDPRIGYTGPGHWTRFKTGISSFEAEAFEPLTPAVLKLHQRIKSVFDPKNVFNPTRMYCAL